MRSGRRFAECACRVMRPARRPDAFSASDASNDDYAASGGAAVDRTTLVLLGPHFGHV
jgi:hypothetical protein